MRDVSARLAAPPAPGSDTPAVVEVRPGGGGANTAAWLARLGVPVVFAGCVGDDDAGREAARSLAEAGVDAAAGGAPLGPTGACVVIVGPDGERTMLTDPGANARLEPGRPPARRVPPRGPPAPVRVRAPAGREPRRRRRRAGRRPRGGDDRLGRPGLDRPAGRGWAARPSWTWPGTRGRSSRPATRRRCSPARATPSVAAPRLLRGPRRGRPEARGRGRGLGRRGRRLRARPGGDAARPRARQHRRRRRVRGRVARRAAARGAARARPWRRRARWPPGSSRGAGARP